MAEPRTGFPKNKRLLAKLLERNLLSPAPDVLRWYDQDHPVGSEVAELQVRAIGLPSYQTEADLPALDLGYHLHAVADFSLDLDIGEPLMEDRKKRRQQVFARDRAGTQR